MNQTLIRKYFFLSLLLISIGFAVLILWPFAKVIVLSIAFTAILYPIYQWLFKKIKIPWVAAFITVIGFIVILCIPVFTIGTIVFRQSQDLYTWVMNNGGINTLVDGLEHTMRRVIPTGTVDIKEGITSIVGSVTAGAGTFFSATLATIFSMILMALSMFYFFVDGAQWKKALLGLSPLSHNSDHLILHKLNAAVNGIVKGYLLIALVQGILMGVGLFIFGVPHAALWGVLAGIASLVPTIGTALVTVPAIIFLFIVDRSGAAIGMALWGGLLVGTVDNVLNPIVVGKKINIHPLLVLFSVLGGIALMGPVGILIGPLVISLIFALTSVYKTEMV